MSPTFYTYLSFFSRIVIITIFSISSWGKFTAPQEFEAAIVDFRIVSPKLAKPLAFLFMIIEPVIVLLLLFKQTLSVGFLSAAFLLVVFTVALIAVIVRQLRIPCNCFGRNAKVVSWFDVSRNAILLTCALLGFISIRSVYTAPQKLGITDQSLLFFIAIAFAVLILNIEILVLSLKSS